LSEHGIVRPPKGRVLGNGSICGVDTARFAPNPQARNEVRREFGLKEEEILLVYMARLTVDKGAIVMANAFLALCDSTPNRFRLLMIGPDEESLTPQIEALLAPYRNRLHLLGYTREPQKYIAAADTFCLPSYREGFPMVLLNAAACGVTAVASRVHGSTDAILDGQTGVLHDAGDSAGLAEVIGRLASDPALRQRLGAAARQRVESQFSERAVNEALNRTYMSELDRAGAT